VLLHGRMYITNKFICFYSNLFGLEKKIRIPYSHIKKISKENTAMVIPNAIAISTDKKDYTFRSFWDREDCYRILTAFLNKYRGVDTAGPTSRQSFASTSGEGGGQTPRGTESKRKSLSAHGSADENDEFESELKHAGDASGDGSSAAGKNDGGEDKGSFNEEAVKATLKIPVVANFVLPISLNDFVSLVISDDAPYSYKRYHESVKDSEVTLSQWSELPGGHGFNREMKFFKPVNLPGLASTRGMKLQKYQLTDGAGLILCSSTRLEDVPYADSFSVDDTLIVKASGDDSVTIEISFQVQFLKNTMMKYFIEKSTNGEMAKWLEVFASHLKKITELKKEGKLDMSAVAAETEAPTAAEGDSTAVGAPASASATAAADTAKAGGGGGGAVEGFAAMLSFRNENVGDQIKFLLCVLLVGYLVLNYLRWKAVTAKLADVEAKLANVEQLAQLLVAQSAKLLQ